MKNAHVLLLLCKHTPVTRPGCYHQHAEPWHPPAPCSARAAADSRSDFRNSMSMNATCVPGMRKI